MNATFRNRLDRNVRKSRGQAMTEYILVVTLVAIGCLTAVTVFGQKVSRLFKAATQSLDSPGPVTAERSEVAKIKTDFSLADMSGESAKKSAQGGSVVAGRARLARAASRPAQGSSARERTRRLGATTEAEFVATVHRRSAAPSGDSGIAPSGRRAEIRRPDTPTTVRKGGPGAGSVPPGGGGRGYHDPAPWSTRGRPPRNGRCDRFLALLPSREVVSGGIGAPDTCRNDRIRLEPSPRPRAEPTLLQARARTPAGRTRGAAARLLLENRKRIREPRPGTTGLLETTPERRNAGSRPYRAPAHPTPP